MHERNGAQLVCLAALAAVNCLGSVIALILRGAASPGLGAVGALIVASAWMIWLGALRSWIRSVQVASSPGAGRCVSSRLCMKTARSTVQM